MSLGQLDLRKLFFYCWRRCQPGEPSNCNARATTITGPGVLDRGQPKSQELHGLQFDLAALPDPRPLEIVDQP
jgi:hypothetical protein